VRTATGTAGSPNGVREPKEGNSSGIALPRTRLNHAPWSPWRWPLALGPVGRDAGGGAREGERLVRTTSESCRDFACSERRLGANCSHMCCSKVARLWWTPVEQGKHCRHRWLSTTGGADQRAEIRPYGATSGIWQGHWCRRLCSPAVDISAAEAAD
jgi:hypothetical protein